MVWGRQTSVKLKGFKAKVRISFLTSNLWKIQFLLLYLPTQIRSPIGGERVTCRGLNLSNSLGRIKLTNSLGKQQLELWTRT